MNVVDILTEVGRSNILQWLRYGPWPNKELADGVYLELENIPRLKAQRYQYDVERQLFNHERDIAVRALGRIEAWSRWHKEDSRSQIRGTMKIIHEAARQAREELGLDYGDITPKERKQ